MRKGLLAVLAIAGIATQPAAAEAREQTSLGDFHITADRVPDWFPLTGLPRDTSDWSKLDVTNPSQMSGLGCSTVRANDSGSDRDALNCALERAPDRTVLLLPAGRYQITGSNGGLIIARGNVVLRGAGSGQTVLLFDQPTGAFRDGCGRKFVNVCGSGGGTDVDWTGGYGRGTSILRLRSVAGFTRGAYVFIREDDDPAVIQNSQTRTGYLNHIAKVAKVDPGGRTITLDRPLRHDFGRPTSSGHRVRVVRPISTVGIEDLTLEHQSRNESGFVIGFNWTVESWVSGVTILRWNKTGIGLSFSARNRIVGNELSDLFSSDAFGHRTISLDRGAVENVVENNIILNAKNGIEFQLGSSGNVVAYNFYRPRAGGCAFRSLFFHGNYARENLVEGNDVQCPIELDNFWGQQGPRNTLYRNRVMGNVSQGGNQPGTITSHADNSGRLTEFLNVLGNIAPDIFGRPGCGSQKPAECKDIDRFSTFMHLENNVARGAFVIGTPEPTTTLELNAQGRDRAPSSWTGMDVPDSLYLAGAPSWWCQEACPFAGERGIGAFGDDFSAPGKLCKLPAQIRREGLACTPLNEDAADPIPEPPVLLNIE